MCPIVDPSLKCREILGIVRVSCFLGGVEPGPSEGSADGLFLSGAVSQG
jgi:hypothetical protein